MKNKKSLKLLILALLLLAFQVNSVHAQDEMEGEMRDKDMKKEEMKYKAFNAGLTVKNMHIWHGFVVHPGFMWAGSLEYKSRNKKFIFGFWGGTSLASHYGDAGRDYYREVSIYTKYNVTDKFFIEAVSHNNYSGEPGNTKPNYWKYGKNEGKNFVDLNFGLALGNRHSLYLATILFGHSGDIGDVTLDDPADTASYTHFLQYTGNLWKQNDAALDFVLGGAWSFITKKTFYTDNGFNVIEVAFKYTDKVKLGKKFKLPISSTLMWNPEKRVTVLEVGVGIF